LPTVITEAMACRLPVISTTVTGIPEMVLHAETGLLVEPGDEASLAEAIARLGADPEARVRMGEAGRAHADRLFTFGATAAVLGEKLAAVCARQEVPKRRETPIVYLVHRWRGGPLLRHGPRVGDGVRWLAEHMEWPESGGDREALEGVEMLPDASVIESVWLRRAEARRVLEEARGPWSDHVSGEAFYRAARHAVYLAEVLPKRGTRHVHARGSEALITVWLLRQLLPGLHTSCAIEDEPGLSRGLLARVVTIFDVVSVSDKKLAGQLSGKPSDDLQMSERVQRSELRLGPVRIKRKVAAVPVDRVALESAFLKRIREAMPAI
jgi:hypothetical protein